MSNSGTNWIDFYVALLGVVQAAVLPAFLILTIALFNKQLKQIILILAGRIRRGDKFELFGLSIETQQQLKKIKRISPPKTRPENSYEINDPESIEQGESLTTAQQKIFIPSSETEWGRYRAALYENRKGFHLSQIITPSNVEGQKYDVFILVDRHKPKNPNDKFKEVESAEFFLGRYWGNKVFKEKPEGNVLGFLTSAYGSFLCVCKLNVKNAPPIMLDIYVDLKTAPEV